MRLKARVELTYAGKTWQSGMLFDALERDGREMINRDEAMPFNLEDPSTRTLEDKLESLLPPEPPVPPEAVVSISPTGSIPPAAGGSNFFQVTMTGEGTWSATTGTPWITIDSPTDPQTQSGDVHYSVDSNPGPGVRAGEIQVNSEIFTVTQAAPLLP